jgi:hypothetical protein
MSQREFTEKTLALSRKMLATSQNKLPLRAAIVPFNAKKAASVPP